MLSDRGRTSGQRVRSIAVALAAACTLFTPHPAAAFEFLGIHLWGEKKDPLKDVIVDPVSYEPVLALAIDDPKMLRSLERASLLINQKNVPPSGTVGLLQRAKDDQANLVGKLYEDGYFGGLVKIRIGGRLIEDISVMETFADPSGTVPVSISVDPGPVFSFGRITIRGGPGRIGARGCCRGRPDRRRGGVVQGHSRRSRGAGSRLAEGRPSIRQDRRPGGHRRSCDG